jgi:hypothetical protein
MRNAFAARILRIGLFVAAATLSLLRTADADPVPVRHVEGTLHGFLVLRAEDGHQVAVGDLIQVAHGSRITSRLVFRFKDGSVDDDTTVYSERGTFRLISDHHVQKGPFFPHQLDMSIDARSGQVTTRSTGSDGKEDVKVEHMDLPPDLANGLLLALTKNLPPDAPETKVSMIVPVPKPRLVKLVIGPAGDERFLVAGRARKARRFDIKFELGGITGKLAPLIGKQPPDLHIWILEGLAPAFVKEQGILFEGGPVLTIELTSPVWPRVSP